MKFTRLVYNTLLLVGAVTLACLPGIATTQGSSQSDRLKPQRIDLEQLGVSLSVPAGWHFQPVETQAARLVPSKEAQRRLTAASGVIDREIKLWPI